MTIVNIDRLILAMISDALEKDATTQETKLKGLDVDVDAELVPGIGSNKVGDDGREKPVHIEHEPKDEDTACYQLNEPCPVEAARRPKCLGRQAVEAGHAENEYLEMLHSSLQISMGSSAREAF